MFAFHLDAYRAENLMYEWKEGESSFLVDDSAKALLRNQGWDLVSTKVESDISTTSVGDYSEGKIIFKLRKITV